ncbi:MAG: type II secretion system protein [Actinomycetota bacterium]
MLRTRLALLRDEEEGFTLIELMVVVMILAILIVMGLPTFLGVKSRFQDRAAQSDLRNTVLSARIMFTDNATFITANETASGLVTIVPNMCYVAGGTASAASGVVGCVSGAGGGSISVASTATQFSAARLSTSTSCFVILDATTGTKYGKTAVANCNATWAGTAGNVTATTPAAAGW